MMNFKRIAESKYFDILGVAVVLIAVYMLGYYKTPLKASWLFASHSGLLYTLPLIGILSTLSAIASIMSTRLTAKVNNLGNVIGWINAIFSGLIDFLLGNVGAVLTYPVSVFLNWKAGKNWKEKYQDKFGQPKHFGLFLTAVIIGSFVVGFGLNYIAYVYMAHWTLNAVFYSAAITFSLSLVANTLNVFKLPSQWSFWGVYNFAQLYKALTLMNVANIAKYSYYILNSVVVGISWAIQKKE